MKTISSINCIEFNFIKFLIIKKLLLIHFLINVIMSKKVNFSVDEELREQNLSPAPPVTPRSRRSSNAQQVIVIFTIKLKYKNNTDTKY